MFKPSFFLILFVFVHKNIYWGLTAVMWTQDYRSFDIPTETPVGVILKKMVDTQANWFCLEKDMGMWQHDSNIRKKENFDINFYDLIRSFLTPEEIFLLCLSNENQRFYFVTPFRDGTRTARGYVRWDNQYFSVRWVNSCSCCYNKS